MQVEGLHYRSPACLALGQADHSQIAFMTLVGHSRSCSFAPRGASQFKGIMDMILGDVCLSFTFAPAESAILGYADLNEAESEIDFLPSFLCVDCPANGGTRRSTIATQLHARRNDCPIALQIMSLRSDHSLYHGPPRP